jgi:hypothetical protein
MSWFEVNKSGLSAVLERRGKFFALAELISNAWDSGSDRVEIRLRVLEGEPCAILEVEDWGEGFADLDEAFTMFAPSRRAGDAAKRGRFSLGEKLVLAICRSAAIITTTGGLTFGKDGTRSRRHPKGSRDTGTLFTAEIRMTRDEFAEVCDQIKHLIPPVETKFNGRELPRFDSLARFETKLPTEIADADGQLRRTIRTAAVEVYEASDGRGEILELGVPVVETENGYRVNVLQKIPLNMDRDNVTPAFLRAINAALLNNLHEQLTPESAAAPWAQEAAGDARATPEAVKSVIEKRFGDRAVVATPGDPMANAQAEAAGYTVIPGGSLSGDVWSNVRKHNLLTSAGKAFPSLTPEQREKIQAASDGKCPLCGK